VGEEIFNIQSPTARKMLLGMGDGGWGSPPQRGKRAFLGI